MRLKLLVVSVLLAAAAACVGGAVVFEDPQLAQQGASFLGGQLQRWVPTPTAPPVATQKPAPVQLRPLDTPALIAPPSSTPLPAATVLPRSSPYTLPWSTSDTQWVISTLQDDARLDIENGADQYPLQASYYEMWSARWTSIAGTLEVTEQEETPLPVGFVQQAAGWFALAVENHQQDEESNPQNAAWDTTWIDNYERLESLFAELSQS